MENLVFTKIRMESEATLNNMLFKPYDKDEQEFNAIDCYTLLKNELKSISCFDEIQGYNFKEIDSRSATKYVPELLNHSGVNLDETISGALQYELLRQNFVEENSKGESVYKLLKSYCDKMALELSGTDTDKIEGYKSVERMFNVLDKIVKNDIQGFGFVAFKNQNEVPDCIEFVNGIMNLVTKECLQNPKWQEYTEDTVDFQLSINPVQSMENCRIAVENAIIQKQQQLDGKIILTPQEQKESIDTYNSLKNQLKGVINLIDGLNYIPVNTEEIKARVSNDAELKDKIGVTYQYEALKNMLNQRKFDDDFNEISFSQLIKNIEETYFLVTDNYPDDVPVSKFENNAFKSFKAIIDEIDINSNWQEGTLFLNSQRSNINKLLESKYLYDTENKTSMFVDDIKQTIKDTVLYDIPLPSDSKDDGIPLIEKVTPEILAEWDFKLDIDVNKSFENCRLVIDELLAEKEMNYSFEDELSM